MILQKGSEISGIGFCQWLLSETGLAGILIYNGLVDIIVPVFTLTAVIKGRIVMQLLAIAIMFAGYSAMALIAKWV